MKYIYKKMNSNEGSRKGKKDLVQTLPKNKFENVKNKYILKRTFNNLTIKKFLEIVKYNKKIRQRLNLNINDYKQYSEEFSSIQIEIIKKE